jgi:hypothetical protein
MKLSFVTAAVALLVAPSVVSATEAKPNVVPDDYPGNSYVHVGVLGHGEFTHEEEGYLATCLEDSFRRTHGNLDMYPFTYKYQVAGVAEPGDDNALKVAPLYRRAEYCDGEFMCRKFYSILVLFCPSCSSLLTLVQHDLPVGATNLESWCWHCTCCVSTDCCHATSPPYPTNPNLTLLLSSTHSLQSA